MDDEGLAAVALTLFSDPDAGLGDSDFESAFDSNLGGTLRNTFDVDNQVPAFRDFYVGKPFFSKKLVGRSLSSCCHG